MQVEIVDGHVDLDMGEWASAESAEILETGGAATCGIVAVLNHSQRRAWMVHQTAPHMILDDTNEMLDDAAAQAQRTDQVDIWLAGCGSGQTKHDDQQALIDAVGAHFSGNSPKVHWGQHNLCVVFDDNAGRWTASFD